eukprot:1091403-Prorocentrum_minimum.AAC.3
MLPIATSAQWCSCNAMNTPGDRLDATRYCAFPILNWQTTISDEKNREQGAGTRVSNTKPPSICVKVRAGTFTSVAANIQIDYVIGSFDLWTRHKTRHMA